MKLKSLSLIFAVLCLSAVGNAITISVGVSGEGAVNDSTVIAGEPFSVDVFFVNDSLQRAFTIGFKMTSDNIKQIVHIADSGKGLSVKGDVKAYNGWEDKSIWDLNGLFVVETNWDGALPDTIGFGGVCIKQAYNPHEKMRCISWDVMVPTEGSFVVDSSFWPPSGIWVFAGDSEASRAPKWGGPLKVKVVSKAAAADAKAAPKPKEGKK